MEFWYMRNSWGTYWGEEGFARIMMHKDNLGLETDCDWGVPLLKPASDYKGDVMMQDIRHDQVVSKPTPRVPKGTYFDYKNPSVRKSKVGGACVTSLSGCGQWDGPKWVYLGVL